jgi:hypothetical protein
MVVFPEGRVGMHRTDQSVNRAESEHVALVICPVKGEGRSKATLGQQGAHALPPLARAGLKEALEQ